jgi:hypothetical protein
MLFDSLGVSGFALWQQTFGEMETSGLLQSKKEMIFLVAKHSLSLL